MQEKKVKARLKTWKGDSLFRAAGKVIKVKIKKRRKCTRRESIEDLRHGKETAWLGW